MAANSMSEDERITEAHRAATTNWQAIGEETGFDSRTLVALGRRWFPSLGADEIECLIQPVEA